LRRFLRFTRVVAAVDLGVAVKPDVVMAQIEGSIGFALSMVLRYAAKRHRPAEQFRRLRADRIREMPKVEVHIPTGIWEPDLSPVSHRRSRTRSRQQRASGSTPFRSG